jgi:hypothetical protein
MGRIIVMAAGQSIKLCKSATARFFMLKFKGKCSLRIEDQKNRQSELKQELD